MIRMKSDRLFLFKQGETYLDSELPRNLKSIYVAHGYAEEVPSSGAKMDEILNPKQPDENKDLGAAPENKRTRARRKK